MGADRPERRAASDLRRVEAFSDGVFTIAATLLVLNLGVRVGRHSLGDELLAIWPSYVAYSVSFLVIAIIWLNHHAMVNRLGRVNHAFMFGNVLLLMLVAFIPFPTKILAEHFCSDGTVSAAFYGGTMTIVGIAFSLLQTYTLRSHLCEVSRRESRTLIMRSWLGPPVYATATALAVISPTASLIVYAAVALFFVAPLPQRPRHPELST